MSETEKGQMEKIMARIQNGELMNQKCWSFIRELNSASEERLNSVAIHDGYRQYTYRQMFRYWERYAEVFSALNITGENHSRAILVTTPITESIFTFYGLNMTGADVSLIYHFDLYDEKRIQNMIEKEKITDLIVSELFAFPKVMKNLVDNKEKLGLRNIIVVESPMGGEFGIPALEALRKMNADMDRKIPGCLLMEDLLKKYEATPIIYGNRDPLEPAVILHTTGTVSGIHKPVPMSDKAINAFVVSAIRAKDSYEDFKAAPSHMVSCLTLNMSWVYAMVDMLHTSLGLGMELVTLPIGGSNPRYPDAIVKCGISILFTSKAILDTWSKTLPHIDLSKLKVVFMGGSYVSPEFKKSFNSYLESCGSTARLINGYGLSELGGACIIAPSNRQDDAIGYPLPGFKVKIFSEEEKRFYDLSDGPRTGVLFISSPTMSTGKLDDTVFFRLDEIDGELYFNSNDKVRVNEDGSMTCIGRSNQFFVNNEGVRFDAGLVENAVSSQPGIAACGLAPEFHKTLHDNVPILYVETTVDPANELIVLRNALVQAFINDGVLADTNLPSQCVLVDTIPRNTGGKVDARKLASGTVHGRRFHVKPVKLNDIITDIVLVPASVGEDATMGAGVPEELENDPYNILSEVFAAIPDITSGRYSRIFRIPGLREMLLKLTDVDIRNIPASLKKVTPQVRKFIEDQLPANLLSDTNKKKMPGVLPKIPGMDFMPPIPMIPPIPPVPPVPGFGFLGLMMNDKDEERNQWEKYESKLDAYWDQVQYMQDTYQEASKEQWNKVFGKMLELEDTFNDGLSDNVPALPGILPFFMPAMSPKAFMKKMKEMQEMANAHATEQADNFAELVKQGQKQFRKATSEAVKKVKEQAVENAEEKKD